MHAGDSPSGKSIILILGAALALALGSAVRAAAPSPRLDFSLDDLGDKVVVPANYQPIPSLVIHYDNVGLFRGGPDHTSGAMGGGNYNAYQFQDGIPEAFSFSQPVSLPCLWLATYPGSGDQVVLRVFGGAQATNFLGTVYASTATFAGPGNYLWQPCTNLDAHAFNGLIRRLEISSVAGVNANVDDLEVVVNTNLGPLLGVQVRLPRPALFVGGHVPVAVAANYQSAEAVEVKPADVTFRSSDTNVFTVAPGGWLLAHAVGDATLTASFGNFTSAVPVRVAPGRIVDFNVRDGVARNRTPVPADYQPIPGLRIGYINAALFNGGPDATAGVSGSNNFNTYQFEDQLPQAFTFNRPVSLPSLSVATFTGFPDHGITISAYADVEGADLMGSVFVVPARSPGAGHYAWSECTNFDGSFFNGHIRRIEFSSAGNANVDDLVVDVATNLGALRQMRLTLPITRMFPGMSRQAAVLAAYESLAESDIAAGYGVSYASSDSAVVTVSEAGLVSAVGPGRATISAALAGRSSALVVQVQPLAGTLIDFDGSSMQFSNRAKLPPSYQPVPGLAIGYTNVGIFNGGPDHTAGCLGSSHFNTFQLQDGMPQVFTFSRAVSLPSLWLSTYWGSGDQITISAYGDTGGDKLLGTVFFTTATFAGPKNYVWLQCTNLDATVFNGLIRRIELFDSSGNAQLDDMVVR